jgi:hypothetical protein
MQNIKINTKYVVHQNKSFKDWCENLHFYILWQVNLFYISK